MVKQQFTISITLMLLCCLVIAKTPTIEFRKSLRSLQLIHVLFRHGDRTQDRTYPNDPYQNETYYPVGVGQLTNTGKLREYRIGTYLRKIYNNFLNDTYFPGILAANSSFYPRCRASMELVLAGLFPPSPIQQWNKQLHWQPIPYDYTPVRNDFLFWPSIACRKFYSYIVEYRRTNKFRRLYEPYSDVLNYLQKHSGIRGVTNIAAHLYSIFKSQVEWPVSLPDWARQIWPEPMLQMSKLDWKHYYPTKNTITIAGGFLMSKIIKDSQLKFNGDRSLQDTKIFLYSGHDTNLAAILSWLRTSDLHSPHYGSFLVFEIHKIANMPYMRIVHQTYTYPKPRVIRIPDCGYYCELSKFVKLYADYLNPEPLCN